MDADAPAEAGQHLHREGVVDLGGGCVVDRKGGDVGARQCSAGFRDVARREGGAARKILDEKTLEVVVVRRADGAAFRQQVDRGKSGICTGGFQRLRLQLVAVRLVEQFAQQRRKFRRQHARLQRFDHALDGERLLTLLFKTGQSGCQNVGRGFLEAAFTLAMEVDGCCV